MRIVVNDYSGHPFQVQLSRELARHGHHVLHLHFADFQTPKGHLHRSESDPADFRVEGVSLGKAFAKYDLLQRRSQEIQYGRLAIRKIREFAPDVVIGCNNPLDAQRIIQGWCIRNDVKFVFWLQDIYSIAINEVLSRKFGFAGSLVGTWYNRLERRLLRRSHAIVAISDDFVPQLRSWAVPDDRVKVIPNWAPLDEITVRPKLNAWSERQKLAESKVILLTGTLGFKHNPGLFLDLAEHLKPRADVKVAVVSEGPSADHLKTESQRRGLTNLVVFPFQPMSEYSDVLGAGDVLVSIIEDGAARYSVPSKVLSYLCSGRPLVLSVPQNNLAARTVQDCGAGLVVPPNNAAAFCAAVDHLLDNPREASRMGSAARCYAEKNFRIEDIAVKFMALFQSVGAAARAGT